MSRACTTRHLQTCGQATGLSVQAGTAGARGTCRLFSLSGPDIMTSGRASLGTNDV